jgi:hypothetical protein
VAAQPISLRAGQHTLELPVNGPVAAEQVAVLVEAANATARIAGLPDTLNPGVIDPAKATGFATGLFAQQPAVRARLDGKTVWLNWEQLGLSTAAPTRSDAFAAGFDLMVDDVQGDNVLAHTNVPIDTGLAKSRTAEAEHAVAAAHAEVQRLEAAGDSAPAGALGQARLRRSAAARAWRINARAWASAVPQDAAAQASTAEANRAARQYAMPSGAAPGG